ncbi:hypothetical protein JAAARDRAFT_207264 [Jaapia argillacea MUCL 33604]|uniref:Uncharacterized protein n=1 Tax=Jaapia argillacea MUCL 33604 TaxID=933084 RepID=A0A067PSS4_9AGAM|nr:hypothetical protein JAAARDRAFT_207264 [Jaapia argillacea MUCL 33604]
MSVSSYRLEAPRPRPPPLPLRFQSSSARPSSVSLNDKSETLLYDLPSTTSPPPGPSSRSNATSPTSPTFGGRTRGIRSRGMTPPPTSHPRSSTPTRALRSDIEGFAEHCRAWYYNQDEHAGRLMTQTLSTLPPSQRAPFARLQASIRSAYHAHMSARRAAEFQAHLSATNPGGSLMPHSRADPAGTLARKERYERFERFVRTWCTMGMPGTKPFFEGLWAMMRLQVVPENLGGAGGLRIDWEIDDAVFKESAGKDFMLEAIDVLKGVLGFEEVATPKLSPSWSPFPTLTRSHSRSRSQPLPLITANTTTNSTLPIPTANRPRAPSDPFTDTPPLSHSLVTTSSSSSYPNNNAHLSTYTSERDGEEPPTPITPSADPSYAQGSQAVPGDSEEELYLRIWTSPDLSNPEYVTLLKLFPSFITRRQLPRFPVNTTSGRPADLEEGEDDADERREVRCGTGTMWISSKERSDGWQGSWWTRVLQWFRRMFC